MLNDMTLTAFLRRAKVRISAMVINRFGERDQSGRWCCAVNGL
ncbi:transposase [Burkholderia multivorans CGD1]|nr:transposase [Burkholderia multivorans CGD1]